MTKQFTDLAQDTHTTAEATANEEAAQQALVDELLLAALRQRCEHTEGDELDDALIAVVVQAHLERHPPVDVGCPTRGSPPSAAA